MSRTLFLQKDGSVVKEVQREEENKQKGNKPRYRILTSTHQPLGTHRRV